jgi:membrane protein required for colicin V production
LAIVDIIVLGIVTLSCAFGGFRGLVKEALSLAFWIAAAVLGVLFSDDAAIYVAGSIENPVFKQAAGFVVVFVVTVIVGAIISNLCSKLMSAVGLGGVDRMLGALFGIIRGLVIVTVMVMLTAPLEFTRELYGQSILLPYFLVMADFFQGLFGLGAETLVEQ